MYNATHASARCQCTTAAKGSTFASSRLLATFTPAWRCGKLACLRLPLLLRWSNAAVSSGCCCCCRCPDKRATQVVWCAACASSSGVVVLWAPKLRMCFTSGCNSSCCTTSVWPCLRQQAGQQQQHTHSQLAASDRSRMTLQQQLVLESPHATRVCRMRHLPCSCPQGCASLLVCPVEPCPSSQQQPHCSHTPRLCSQQEGMLA